MKLHCLNTLFQECFFLIFDHQNSLKGREIGEDFPGSRSRKETNIITSFNPPLGEKLFFFVSNMLKRLGTTNSLSFFPPPSVFLYRRVPPVFNFPSQLSCTRPTLSQFESAIIRRSTMILKSADRRISSLQNCERACRATKIVCASHLSSSPTHTLRSRIGDCGNHSGYWESYPTLSHIISTSSYGTYITNGFLIKENLSELTRYLKLFNFDSSFMHVLLHLLQLYNFHWYR